MSIIAYFIEWNNVEDPFIKYENLSIFIIINQYATLSPPPPKFMAWPLYAKGHSDID